VSKHATLTGPAIKHCQIIVVSYASLLQSNCTHQHGMSNLKVGIFVDKHVSSYLIYAYIQGDSREDDKDRG
jgi:hypothetical protein